jgi:[acyl-carrier-protein] S-malonyltransferase
VVFPGQGSQSVGMMKGFGDRAVVERTFREASDILGEDLWQLAAEGPAEALNRTVVTQPLMLTAGVACWRAWREKGGPMPAFFAGHSLGEYTALVAAGSLAFEDAIVGLADDKVALVCAEAAQGEVLEPANLNSPGQIVIAGHRGAVERGMALAKANGAKIVKMLPMSAPSHCSLMRPAAQRLGERLALVSLARPAVPVVQNADVEAFDDPQRIRQALVEQLYRPVRWVETVRWLAGEGVTRVVECAPGKVLAGLVKRSVEGVESFAVTDSAALDAALA